MSYGNNGSMTINQTTGGPTRELLMPLAMADLINQINRIGKVAEDLAGRLDKICTPQPPNQEGVNPTPAQPKAEYVRELEVQAERIRRISEGLENILSRLEL